MAKKEKEKEKDKNKEKDKEAPAEASAETAASSPLEKISMLLLYLEAISPQVTKSIYEHIGEQKSQTILKSISNLGKVEKSTIKPIITEAHTILINQDSVIGGKHLSGKIITGIYGEKKEDSESEDTEVKRKEGTFLFLEKIEDNKLIDFFDKSTTSMAAFIFSLLSEEKGAGLLQKLDQDTSNPILQKAVNLKINNLPILDTLGEELEKELTKTDEGIQIKPEKQIEHLTHILEIVTEEQRNSILEQMKKDNKEIAEIIEQKIFTFKDLVSCEDEDLALIITDIKNLKSLAFALKKCDDALSEKLKNNLSARQKEILTEEEKTMPEKIKDKDVANAHSEILGIAKKLAKSEKINPLIKESKGKDKKEKK